MKISACISTRIRQILNERSLSIYRLELMTGISHNTMMCLLNNRYNSANIKTVFIIIQALGYTIADFFNCDVFSLENIEID